MKHYFEGSFFESALETERSLMSMKEFDQWFKAHCKPEEFHVEEIPFSKLENWGFVNDDEKLCHSSGKFFSIEGLRIHIEQGDRVYEWEQPIINQPEIGILCFITKVIDGVRYFLVQAKMEPGNINTLQISPTLQATRSNFTCVHKGKAPNYLDLFMEKNYKIVIDQLQTEQGGRFLKKRNRNIIIEINHDIEIKDEFCWLSLRQIKDLMKRDNVMNMDSRSVLSMIPLIEDSVARQLKQISKETFRSYIKSNGISEQGVEYINSYVSTSAVHSIEEILSWMTNLKFITQMSVEKVPLKYLKDWHIGEREIHHTEEKKFFSVNAVKVKAGSREVTSWTQPLVKDPNVGLLAFVAKKINGVLHFLVQGKVEPGNLDVVEMSPTVSCSNYLARMKSEYRPYLFDEVLSGKFEVLSDSLQSEEGGRFWQLQNRNMIVKVPDDMDIVENESYIWMSLAQINEFMRFGKFNIEARSIISSIDFI